MSVMQSALVEAVDEKALVPALAYVIQGAMDGQYPNMDAKALAELTIYVRNYIANRMHRFMEAPDAPSHEIQ